MKRIVICVTDEQLARLRRANEIKNAIRSKRGLAHAEFSLEIEIGVMAVMAAEQVIRDHQPEFLGVKVTG